MTRNARLILPSTKIGGDKLTSTWDDYEKERRDFVQAVVSVLDDSLKSLKDQYIIVNPKNESNPKDLDYLNRVIENEGLGVLQNPKALAKLIEIVKNDPYGVPIIDRYNLIKLVYDLINQALADS